MRHGSIIIAGMVTFWVASASAISHVGAKSIGSGKEGFTLRLPFTPKNIVAFDDRSLKLFEFQRPIGGGNLQADYKFFPLSHFFDLSGMTEEEVEEFFMDLGWPSMKDNHCGMSFSRLTKNRISVASTWGEGRGVMVDGPNTRQGRKRVIEMVNRLIVMEEACAWK